MSPGSAIVTAEHACVSPYDGETGQPASRARASNDGSAGAPPSSTTRSDGGGGDRISRASWVGTSDATVTSCRSAGPMTAVVP